MSLRLGVNYIEHGHFVEAGEVIPPGFHVPQWVIQKHRISEEEGLQLCEDRRLHREAVARRKASAGVAAVRDDALASRYGTR
jgi:hypothetical protein